MSKKKLSPDGYFDPHTRIELITVVGLGGTGSQAARSIARILYDLRARGKHIPKMLFVDPDRVEMRNVGRQMFTESQATIGEYKAEALARRFNFALGLDIQWANEA